MKLRLNSKEVSLLRVQRVSKEFTVRATTEDGVKIIFPRAGVSASGKANEKAIGLALVFTALKPTKAGVPIERWEDGEDTTLGG